MDDDNDMTTNVGGSRGSTALPKFNHLYPILFFSPGGTIEGGPTDIQFPRHIKQQKQ